MRNIGYKSAFGKVRLFCPAGHFIQLLDMKLLIGIIRYFDEITLNTVSFSHSKRAESAFEDPLVSGIVTGFINIRIKKCYPAAKLLIKEFLFGWNFVIHQEIFQLRKVFSCDIITSDIFSMAAE